MRRKGITLDARRDGIGREASQLVPHMPKKRCLLISDIVFAVKVRFWLCVQRRSLARCIGNLLGAEVNGTTRRFLCSFSSARSHEGNPVPETGVLRARSTLWTHGKLDRRVHDHTVYKRCCAGDHEHAKTCNRESSAHGRSSVNIFLF